MGVQWNGGGGLLQLGQLLILAMAGTVRGAEAMAAHHGRVMLNSGEVPDAGTDP